MEKLQVAGRKGVVKKKSKVRLVRYGECERNHAVKDGGSTVDGCKEFIASDENGGSALTCSCCGCHRNYHRIVEETDQESFDVGEQKRRKIRELTSEVWDHFTRTIDKYGNIRAICNYCKEQFDGSSKNGTSHLNNHLKSMKCRATRNGGDGNEDVSTQIRDLATPTPVVMKEKSSVIDEDVSAQIRDLTNLTPVVMKEKSAVIDLIKQSFDEDGYPIELWDPSVLNSRKDEILQVYQEEKEKQGEFLNNLSCRFSLQIVRVCPGLLLMVHYVDDSWERQIKIISIIPLENYIEDTKKACLDLKIDRNICSIRHDGFMSVDDEEIMESWFSQRGSLPFDGVRLEFYGFMQKNELFIDECEMNEIDGLQECVDYGYKTSSNNVKLQHAVNNAKTMGKKVIFGYQPIPFLNGPLQYLEVAVGLKEAFSELEKIDSDFISINLTNRKWDEATATFEHFKALEEFVGSFNWDNCSSITTGVVDILKLFRFHSSEDCQVCKNASYKKLFDKIQVYLVVVILDPRFKMDTIQCWYKEFYGSDADGYFEKTLKDFRDVYDEYAKDSGEDYKMMDAMGRPCTSSTKSELDLYLHHLKVPAVEGFDILAWWRGNAPFYPTLSRMARDYLAIPIIINEILFDLYFFYEIYDIKYCIEIDDDIKSALMYLSGLVYYQAKVEKNE